MYKNFGIITMYLLTVTYRSTFIEVYTQQPFLALYIYDVTIYNERKHIRKEYCKETNQLGDLSASDSINNEEEEQQLWQATGKINELYTKTKNEYMNFKYRNVSSQLQPIYQHSDDDQLFIPDFVNQLLDFKCYIHKNENGALIQSIWFRKLRIRII